MKDMKGWKIFHSTHGEVVRFEMVTDEPEPLHICLDMSHAEARNFAYRILNDVREDDDPRMGLPLKSEPLWPTVAIMAFMILFFAVLLAVFF